MMEISKRKKIIISTVFVLIFAAVFNISAESIWEGSAAMGRYGEFPFTGYYGASNSFPQNAFVEVENLENGKRTRLIVVDRLSDSGLLMLVSNEAAQELGIYQSDIARIKVRMLSTANTVETPQYDDLAYNPDPDLNPAAALMTPEELILQEIVDSRIDVEPEPEVVVVPDPVPEPEVVVVPDPVPEPEVVVVPEPVPEPEVVVVPEPEPEPEVVVVPEPEPEPEIVVVPEPEPEPEFPVLSELPPKTDGLSEAEILVKEEIVPVDIASDTPEKPFDWPESIRTETEQKEIPEPLYLTMDDFEEVGPLAEGEGGTTSMHSPETEQLWPDGEADVEIVLVEAAVELEPYGLNDASPPSLTDGIGSDGMQIPSVSLELLSSGLGNAEPAYSSKENFNLSILPEIINKAADEDLEYLTEASDYYKPEIKEAAVAITGLPSPEPEIPEEVIAVLVGDHLLISGNEPENLEVGSAYIDSPEIVYLDEDDSSVLTADLIDAYPIVDDGLGMIAEALPALPGGDDSTLVEVANGYISPDEAVFVGEIKDYPDYAGASEPAEIPTTDDELVYSDAPAVDDESDLTEMTEIPEVVKSGDDAAEDEEIADAVPEYDENLEISLVPAEVRPPELLGDETGLGESEPEAVETVEIDIVEHEPEVEETSVVEVEEIVEAPVVEVEEIVETSVVEVEEPEELPVETIVEVAVEEELELIVPEEVMMVSKLQQQRHYLQLGAFKEKNSAIKAAGRLEAVYPVTILTDESTASYKLLLGPLSADESGIMLYNFRAGGYSDAFIRRIE